MSEHTPGPWSAEPSARGFEITAGDRRIGEAHDEANARLIAAAPELLAALERTLSMAIGHAADARGVSPAECGDFPWVKDARATIEKAAGEEA